MSRPARRKRPGSSAPPPSGIRNRLPPLALVVDDVAESRELIAEAFRLSGWRATAVADGASALALAREHAPDVLVLEMDLPRIDGWQVARALKADARTEGIPIVALASDPGPEDTARALEAGCDAALTKAGPVLELVACARALIGEGD